MATSTMWVIFMGILTTVTTLFFQNVAEENKKSKEDER